jgi:hypothetical protein
MKKTNFDLYLQEQKQDRGFAERFKSAGEAWDVALQVAALRQKAELRKNSSRRSKMKQTAR